MKTGRLILTFREDIIPALTKFYLGSRTDFLVIAYNWQTVDPKKFETSEDFKLVPYYAPEDEKGTRSISGLQYRVWLDVAKQFPEIERWVIHDYDLLIRPKDSDLLSHVPVGEYGMIGKAFPVYQPGITETFDTYPFPQVYSAWHKTNHPTDKVVDTRLMELFPVERGGVKTVMGGYSDLIVADRSTLLLLDDSRLHDLPGGSEQVPHTVWHAKGIKPVDLRSFYKTKIMMDGSFLEFTNTADLIHPVKFWPGGTVPSRADQKQNLVRKAKSKVKSLIRYRGWKNPKQ